MPNGLKFSIDRDSIALIVDLEKKTKPQLGTAFVFIQSHWAVTAKHVVIRDGIARPHLALMFPSGAKSEATVLYKHPVIDLAVLLVHHPPPTIPLFPGHHTFASSDGLIVAGYTPSKNTETGPTIEFNRIDSFLPLTRGRLEGNEDIIEYDAPFAEGGNSGGPIFGTNAAVVGAVIDDFPESGVRRARATSLESLVRQLRFPADAATRVDNI
jgi:S1-C subfamily serine protease